MENMNRITTTTCDSCHARRPSVLFHSHGAPVLAECQQCNPQAFERQARRDIDSWLSGGSAKL